MNFESGPERLKFIPYDIPGNREEVVTYFEQESRENKVSYKTINTENMFANGRDSFVISRSAVFNDIQVIITSYDGVLVLEGVKCQHYLAMRSEFLSSLIPVKGVRDVVSQVKNYFEEKVMVGVHYRAYDTTHDWEVVPPMEGGDSANAFGVGATIEDFERLMRKINNAFLTQTGGESVSYVRFFVASNSDTAKQHFLSVFRDAVSISGEYSRGERNGILFALVEWLLLAESQLILNTYGSSFAMEAAQIHLRPLVGVWDGRPIHHTDIRLPFCGHLLYMKEYSSRAVDAVYMEGTADNRVVSCCCYCCYSIYYTYILIQ